MKTINLRDYYPFYHNDLFIEVSDEVAAALRRPRGRSETISAALSTTRRSTRWTLGTVSSRRRCSRLCLPAKSTSEK